MSLSNLVLPEIWEGILVENLPSQMTHLVKNLTVNSKINFVKTVQTAEALKVEYYNELERVHFLLTDLDLNGPNGDKRMNGTILAEEVRADPRYKNLPVIFYTSFPKLFAGTLNTLNFARDKYYGIMLREELTEERLLQWLPRLYRGAFLCTPSIENYIDEFSETLNQSPFSIMKENALQKDSPKADIRILERICQLNGLGYSTEDIAKEMECSVRQLQRWFQDIFKLLQLEDTKVSPQDNRRRLAIMYAAKRWLYWDENGIPRTKDQRDYREIDEINQFRLINAHNRSLE